MRKGSGCLAICFFPGHGRKFIQLPMHVLSDTMAALEDTDIWKGLVDELWLSVHPILLGNGRPLFRTQNSRTQLTLLDSKTYETGLVSLRYQIDK